MVVAFRVVCVLFRPSLGRADRRCRRCERARVATVGFRDHDAG